MLVKSLVSILLSFLAAVALIGLVAAITPTTASITMPLLLMIFPAWLGMACCSYMINDIRYAAAGLISITAIGFGLIALLKATGLAML